MGAERAGFFWRALCAFAAAAGALSGTAGAQPLRLTLEEAVAQGLASHRTLRAAEGGVEGERLSMQTAESAFDLKVLPSTTIGRIGSNAITDVTGVNTSAGVQLSRRFESGTVLSLGPSFNRFGGDRNTTLSFSLEQPLLRGWRKAVSLDPVRRAEFSLSSSQRLLDQARVNVALEVIGAYYGLAREDQLVASEEAQRRRMEQHTLVAESKERSGFIGPNDLLRARITLADAEDALHLERVNREAALNRLRRALDIPLGTDISIDEPAPPRLEDPGRIESDAAERRTEIVQLRAELDEAVRAAQVAELNVAPEVTLRVTAGQASTDPFLAQFLPSTQRQWSVFLQASTDLARTAEKNAWRQAVLRTDSARIAVETKTEEVRRQVREQLLQLADARTRIAIREAQIRQAESRLALAQVKFSHDMASNLDVIDAEGELGRAQAVLANARTDYAVGVYQLRALAGRLLPLR